MPGSVIGIKCEMIELAFLQGNSTPYISSYIVLPAREKHICSLFR